MGTTVVTYRDVEVETLVAQRDALKRAAANEAEFENSVQHTLGTLDRILSEVRDRADRIARLIRWKDTFIEQMERLEWPYFRSIQVVVGTKPEPIWKGLFGHRNVPVFETRAVRTWSSGGITTRGEFIENHRAIRREARVVTPTDPDFDLRGFEMYFEALSDYYGVTLDA